MNYAHQVDIVREVRLSVAPRRARYQEVADDLRAKIANGMYAIDDPLPSISKLMENYEVSATVVQRALSELKHEGLVEGQPGKAVYVLREPPPTEPSAEYVEIMRQIDSLKKTVDETLHELGERVTALEQSARDQ